MKAGAGKEIAKLESRIAKVKDKRANDHPHPTLSPHRAREKGACRLLAASRDAALIQLVLVCTSYEGRSRGLYKDTAPRATGRSHEGDAS